MKGGTGFVGKVIVEVLLRETNVKKIYVLIRVKKNVDPQERLKKEIFGSTVFEWLRTQRDDVDKLLEEKLHAISGDMLEEGLGMAEEDRSLLAERVEVILHCAATVRFDEPLAYALNLNVVGALRILDLAKECKRLRSMVHVSTAYVNCNKKKGLIEDKIYRMDFDAETKVEELRNMSKQAIDKEEKNLLKKYGYPNTYTFTKALAEMLMEERRGGVPLCIVRPTIVGSACLGAQAGWIDNAQAAAAFFVACGLGVMKIVWGRLSAVGDMIPVDLVVNCVITAAVHTAENPHELIVYHSGSSARNPVTWRTVRKEITSYYRAHPSPNRVSVPDFAFISNRLGYELAFFLTFTVPIRSFSTYAQLFGPPATKKMGEKALRMNQLAYKIATEFHHFVINEWTFSSRNSDMLQSKLVGDEKESFAFDAKVVDWHSYIRGMCWGLNHYVLKSNADPHPDEERITPIYFERRWSSLLTDIYWAYSANPRISLNPTIRPAEDALRLVLTSSRVSEAIEREAAKRKLPKETVKLQAKAILDQMGGDYYLPLLRLLAWFFRKIYRSLYDAVMLDERGMHRLKLMLKNLPPNTPLVLLPNHRSYLDFLMMSYVMFAYDLPVPHIAAGDDFLNMLLVRYKSCLSFFQ